MAYCLNHKGDDLGDYSQDDLDRAADELNGRCPAYARVVVADVVSVTTFPIVSSEIRL